MQAGGRRFDPDKLHQVVPRKRTRRWRGRRLRSKRREREAAGNTLSFEEMQIAHGFGHAPVLIHREEKILSGGFQVLLF